MKSQSQAGGKVTAVVTSSLVALCVGSVFSQQAIYPANQKLANDPFPIGLVSLNFDDGRACVIAGALPALKKANIKTDQYIISGRLDQSPTDDSVDTADILAMQADGHVIGGHTRTHPDLSASDDAMLKVEIEGGRSDLIAKGAAPVDTFAYPFGKGATKKAVVDAVKVAGFKLARSTQGGFNFKDTDRFVLKRQSADRAKPGGPDPVTTIAQVRGWVDEAAAGKKWLILLFHHIEDVPDDGFTSPELTRQIIEYVAAQRDAGKIRVVTNSEGLQMMGGR